MNQSSSETTNNIRIGDTSARARKLASAFNDTVQEFRMTTEAGTDTVDHAIDQAWDQIEQLLQTQKFPVKGHVNIHVRLVSVGGYQTMKCIRGYACTRDVLVKDFVKDLLYQKLEKKLDNGWCSYVVESIPYVDLHMYRYNPK